MSIPKTSCIAVKAIVPLLSAKFPENLHSIYNIFRERGNSSKLVDELGIVYAIGLTNINDCAYTLSHSIGAAGVSQLTMTTQQNLSSKFSKIKEGLSMYVYPSYVCFIRNNPEKPSG